MPPWLNINRKSGLVITLLELEERPVQEIAAHGLERRQRQSPRFRARAALRKLMGKLK